mmetsp:Transcript_36835/g.97375  ORF Transcript_36835/g.97375 Transcript_36835/m.97375 type:complete len:254 (-) Transcript_36835:1845-2606(-)
MRTARPSIAFTLVSQPSISAPPSPLPPPPLPPSPSVRSTVSLYAVAFSSMAETAFLPTTEVPSTATMTSPTRTRPSFAPYEPLTNPMTTLLASIDSPVPFSGRGSLRTSTTSWAVPASRAVVPAAIASRSFFLAASCRATSSSSLRYSAILASADAFASASAAVAAAASTSARRLASSSRRDCASWMAAASSTDSPWDASCASCSCILSVTNSLPPCSLAALIAERSPSSFDSSSSRASQRPVTSAEYWARSR